MKSLTSLCSMLLVGAVVSHGGVASPAAAAPAPAAFSLAAPSPAAAPSMAEAPSTAAAHVLHGITVRLAHEGRVVVATCGYDGGTPVAGAQVSLFAPGTDAPYLTGTTDQAGLFAFIPASPGEWRVVVDDGMGHRREARTEVPAAPGRGAGGANVAGSRPGEGHDHAGLPDHSHAGEQGQQEGRPEQDDHIDTPGAAAGSAGGVHIHEPDDAGRPWKLATGLGLIFGLTGFAYGFAARRART